MAFAVSETPRRDARKLRGAAISRPKSRKVAQRVAIHWPRLIALGLNMLMWVAVIAGGMRLLHH